MTNSIENLVVFLIHEKGNYKSGNLFIDFYLDNSISIETEDKNNMLEALEDLENAPYLNEGAVCEIRDLIETLKNK